MLGYGDETDEERDEEVEEIGNTQMTQREGEKRGEEE